MAYLSISPADVKFAGAGAKLQWAMAIGIGVDQFVHEVARPAQDAELLAKIREQLAERADAKHWRDPAALDRREAAAVDGMLRAVGTKLSVSDLSAAFRDGASRHASRGA